MLGKKINYAFSTAMATKNKTRRIGESEPRFSSVAECLESQPINLMLAAFGLMTDIQNYPTNNMKPVLFRDN